MAFFHGAFFPYTNLYNEPKGKDLGSIKLKKMDIEWSDNQEGIISALINDNKVNFEVSISGGEIRLKHKYREWYSYPTQALLVVSMPLDFVIDLVVIPIALITDLLKN